MCSEQEAGLWLHSSVWCRLDTDRDFAQFVAFGPDVVHEHLIGSELVLDGQRVVLTLLHLLQLDSVSQAPHYLNPAASLMEEAMGEAEIPAACKWGCVYIICALRIRRNSSSSITEWTTHSHTFLYAQKEKGSAEAGGRRPKIQLATQSAFCSSFRSRPGSSEVSSSILRRFWGKERQSENMTG